MDCGLVAARALFSGSPARLVVSAEALETAPSTLYHTGGTDWARCVPPSQSFAWGISQLTVVDMSPEEMRERGSALQQP